MDYKPKNKADETSEDYVGPGTAGVAQRVARTYEARGLRALIRNEIMPCSQNQY